MALFQTALTTHLDAAKSIGIVLLSGDVLYGVVTDDGSADGDDSIVLTSGGRNTVVKTSAIAYVPLEVPGT